MLHYLKYFTAILALSFLFCQTPAQSSIDTTKQFVPVGLFFGNISEGARIFTPVRLLPFNDPESKGHQFPTVLQLHGSEYPFLILLGKKIGFKLFTTLERYPKHPDNKWPYPDYLQPPLKEFQDAKVVNLNDSLNGIPGLRVAAFYKGLPVGFIVDTRNLSLKERHMQRATSMGLDISRNDLLKGLKNIAKTIDNSRAVIVVLNNN